MPFIPTRPPHPWSGKVKRTTHGTKQTNAAKSLQVKASKPRLFNCFGAGARLVSRLPLRAEEAVPIRQESTAKVVVEFYMVNVVWVD